MAKSDLHALHFANCSREWRSCQQIFVERPGKNHPRYGLGHGASKGLGPNYVFPYVVSGGKSWGRRRLHDGSEHFFRSSEQLGWIVEERGTVLEEVFIDHASQGIYFT